MTLEAFPAEMPLRSYCILLHRIAFNKDNLQIIQTDRKIKAIKKCASIIFCIFSLNMFQHSLKSFGLSQSCTLQIQQ